MNRRVFALALVGTVLLGSFGWSFLRTGSGGPAMTANAALFIETLTEDQRKTALLEYGTPKRLEWHFIPKDQRKGLQVKEMNDSQRKAAHALLQAALSDVGYDKAVKIMALEKILRELEKERKGALRDPERYYFTIFGRPAGSGRWGLSIEGHHLSLNFVVENGRVISSTPTVFASNPATVMSEIAGGHPKGTRVLASEEQLAFDLLLSLNADQRKSAMIAETAPKDIRAAGEAQPPQTPAEGISAAKLNDAQKKALHALIDAYVNNMPEDVAQARWSAIREGGVDQVHFAWAGADKPGIGHYYRVQGPSFLIEFVNTQADSAGNLANHIHLIWRDMQGDFAIPIRKAS